MSDEQEADTKGWKLNSLSSQIRIKIKNLKLIDMKGTEQFKATIQEYLEYRASTDELFAERYANPKKNIDDCITFILNEVMRQGINGYNDDEIYSMAMHYYDEEDIEVGKPTDCRVVVNHLVELTEEEKQEARQKALRQYQDEELRKIQNRHKPRTATQTTTNVQPSLFDL